MNDIPLRQRRWLLVAGAAFTTLIVGVAVGEWLGWPFLAAPLQRFVSAQMDRRVVFAVPVATTVPAAASAPSASPEKPFHIRFIGGVNVHVPAVEVGPPAWSKTPHMFIARDVQIHLRYVDLWRAYAGQQIRVDSLKAATVDGNLERLADGRASWQFGINPPPPPPVSAVPPTPRAVFGNLQVASGRVRYRDEMLDSEVDVNLTLADAVATAANTNPGKVLQANATGQYRALPLKLSLVSSGVLPWTTDENYAVPIAMNLNATVGRAEFVFNGTATDARRLSGFTGRFRIKGPSLAAVGEPLGVTLPTTAAFRAEGVIVRRTDVWHVLVDDATVGSSRVNGAFMYETGGSIPLLSGRLGGARLLLADLGPAIGMTPGVPRKHKGMVLPDRPFDLAALRKMDANVFLDFAELDLGSRLLEAMRPMQGHLRLADAVLTIDELDARTGGGHLKGNLSFNGQKNVAVWKVNVRWDGVQLERWINQGRTDGKPPFVSGTIQGKAALQGQGRSTAEILATLKGQVRAELKNGKVSHLIVELAGLDLAEGLGLLLTGDKTLSVQCGVADLAAEGGIFRPRVMVLDTLDSAIWIDGSLSLATESLDLRAVVTPKDFSPLTRRTPLRVRGAFARPGVSIEKGPLTRKLATAFLLALANPLAALL
ncbi:MAG: AsmA family protein, partial [Burkholderiales bacterium]|nr:AsmA family protein [Burkholderiales bacterium]